MITEKLTPRVTRMSEYDGAHTRHVYALDGREVLHVCKVYSYYSNGPYYSRVNSCGEYRPEISRGSFNAELKRILSLN